MQETVRDCHKPGTFVNGMWLLCSYLTNIIKLQVILLKAFNHTQAQSHQTITL